MKIKTSLSRGFTLVELMIVIAIIGILAASLYPSLAGYFEKSRDTARTTGVNDYVLALSSYFGDMQSYPGYELAATNRDISICATELYNGYLSGTYLNAPKNDPKQTQWVYKVSGDSCAGDQGWYGYKALQNNESSNDYGFAFVMAANMERWASANFDAGAAWATYQDLTALNWATTWLIPKVVEKWSSEARTLQSEDMDHWYFVKYSQ